MVETRKIAGVMSEEELDSLLEGNISGGVTPTPAITASSIPCAKIAVEVVSIIGGAIAATLSIDACPTSACTKSC